TAAINAAAGPITSKIFKGLDFVVGGPIRYVTKSMNAPTEEVVRRFQNVGVTNPTPGQITGAPFFTTLENAVLSNLPTSTNIMRENAQGTLEQIAKETERLVEAYGGTRTFSEAAEKTMDSLQASRARYDDKVNEMYDEVRQLLPDDYSSGASNVQEFIKKLIRESDADSMKVDVAPALNKALDLVRDAEAGKLNFNTLQKSRSSLRRLVEKAEAQSAGKLNLSEAKMKELIGYMTKDLDALVKFSGAKLVPSDTKSGALQLSAKGPSLALEKYKAANDFVRENMKPGGDMKYIDSVIKKGQNNANDALRAILSPSKLGSGSQEIESLRKNFNADEFEILSGFILGRLGVPNFAQMGAEEVGQQAARQFSDEGFSPARFITNWNKMSPEAKKSLFGKTQYEQLVPALDDLVFTIDRIGKTASDMANPSGTARALAAMGQFGAVFLGEGVFGKMLGSEGFEYGFGGLIAPYASAKLMTNPSFVKWLTQGVEKAVYKPNTFGQHVRRLYQIHNLNPDIRDEVRAVLHGLTQETIEPLDFENSDSATNVKTPENNELAFRQVVPKSVADKVLPTKEELTRQIKDVKPSVDINSTIDIFEDLPIEASPSGINP
ncbi:MAG TPA: hypothetical protein DEB18_03390, partial [Leeuwenhoekiella sp.]|nr:hypothetical protein [Leeuwenhoekiella sp.]